MRTFETTNNIARDSRIVAQPPGPPFDRKEPLPVSRARVWTGLVLLISGFVIGSSSSLFSAAKLWLGGIGLLLINASFFVLGLHRLRCRERNPRKLYGRARSIDNDVINHA
jgi:hypothetical protein